MALWPDGSEDEETFQWREDLRRQVEEDLERQVRLRLGLGLKMRQITPEETDEAQAHVLYYQSARLHQQASLYHTDHDHVSELQHSSVEESARVSNERERQQQRGARLERRGGESRKPEERASAARLRDKEQLLLYLSKHHGPPLRQLHQMTRTGSYDTTSHEICSHNIQWPVETSISLPTPQHLRSPPHHLPPSPPSPESPSSLTPSHQAQPTLPPAGEGGGGKEVGRVVYVCGQPPLEAGDDGLIFESQFESGNLHQARRTGRHDYTLILNPDLYSKRHVQWYYFSVTNMETTPTYTFHIVNFEKSSSLYSEGMQPLLYSESEASSTGMGWRRVGWNVTYHCSKVCIPPHMTPDHTYHTLSWSMQFHHHGDTCYLAHCYPYTLTALHRLLGNLEQDKERAKYVQREELCRTLAGNVCPLLTITDSSNEQEEGGGAKRGVVITARVHPGETNSSWMMEGLIAFLTSDSAHAHALRQCFVFKLVPMLNPDGVVVGNYRTSLAGVDLNRVYKTPHKAVFPTIHHVKRMMERFRGEREVCVYVDLHGHSRKHNVFMYGCHTPKADHTHFLYERMLPFLLSEQAPSMFSFASCKFAVERCKEATGRVVTWRSGVPHSFTLETTFCGSNLGPSRWQFTDNDLCEVGRNLGEALYKFSKCLYSKTYQLKVMARLAERLMNKLATPPSTLPDVVTTHSSHKHSSHHQHKRQAQHMLHRFMRLEMKELERESSTSGSDSDNEDFLFKKKKNKHRHPRQRRSRVSSQSQAYGLRHPSPSSPSSPYPSHCRQPQTRGVIPPEKTTPSLHSPSTLLTLPSLLKQATPTTPPSHRHRASAPARLQPSLVGMGIGSKWKFVNRYANRSNGGIPMFAEERLKERSEKRLRSVSEVVHLPPAPSHPNMATSRQYHTSHTHPTPQLPLPLWSSPDSIPLTLQSHKPSPRQQHYQQIKELVEHAHHSPSHHHHLTHHRRPRPHPSLPSHLLSFISEIWNK